MNSDFTIAMPSSPQDTVERSARTIKTAMRGGIEFMSGGWSDDRPGSGSNELRRDRTRWRENRETENRIWERGRDPDAPGRTGRPAAVRGDPTAPKSASRNL